jgi:NitT/TauT family transport system substrate-binding protein
MPVIAPHITSRRTFLGLSAATLGALGLSSCGIGGPSRAGDSDSFQMTHAAGAPALFYAVSFLAEDLGYYKAEGIKVARTFLGGGPPAAAALVSGSAASNISAPGELLGLVNDGQGLQLLMAHTNNTPLVLVLSPSAAERAGVSADSDLASRRAAVAAIDGGRYGITAVGSETYGVMRLILTRAGVDPDVGASLVPLANGANMISAMQSDQIDGFIFVPPVIEEAVEQVGAVPVLYDAAGDIEGGRMLQGQAVQVRTSDVQAEPELYAALIRADVKALQHLVENSNESRDLLYKSRFSDLDERVWRTAWDGAKACWGSPYIGEPNLASWIENGLVKDVDAASSIDFADVINMKFVNDAVESLGWRAPAAPTD